MFGGSRDISSPRQLRPLGLDASGKRLTVELIVLLRVNLVEDDDDAVLYEDVTEVGEQHLA